jgi:type IV pilus assembly protein PilV
MLVVAVGMLGLMAMQVNAKRTNYEAAQRMLATALARDMLERMRSNPEQLAVYVRSDMGARAAHEVSAGQPAVDCRAVDCRPAQLAAHDLREWESMLTGASDGAGINGGLVEPRACISHDAGLVEVAIAWLGINAASNPDASACGANAAGLYDAPSGAPGNNLRRRLLVMGSYIGRQP